MYACMQVYTCMHVYRYVHGDVTQRPQQPSAKYFSSQFKMFQTGHMARSEPDRLSASSQDTVLDFLTNLTALANGSSPVNVTETGSPPDFGSV